jgi:hypothetical protein
MIVFWNSQWQLEGTFESTYQRVPRADRHQTALKTGLLRQIPPVASRLYGVLFVSIQCGGVLCLLAILLLRQLCDEDRFHQQIKTCTNATD